MDYLEDPKKVLKTLGPRLEFMINDKRVVIELIPIAIIAFVVFLITRHGQKRSVKK